MTEEMSKSLFSGSFALSLTALVYVLWMFAGPSGLPMYIAQSVSGRPVPDGIPGPGQVFAMAAFALASPRSLFSLVALFAGMLPVAIAITAVWEGLGSASVVLRREYVSMLVCGLLSWCAAFLP